MGKKEDRKEYLIRIRAECLKRNERFQEDVKHLAKLKKENARLHERFEKFFREDWSITKNRRPIKTRFPVREVSAEKTGTVTLQVDLRYSKEEITKELKDKVRKWKDVYEKEYREQVYDVWVAEETGLYGVDRDEMDFDGFYEHMKKLRIKSLPLDKTPDKRLRSIEDYSKFLKVWDLKRQGKSYSQIAKQLSLNNQQTARDHLKAAKRLIREGPPGLSPFPM